MSEPNADNHFSFTNAQMWVWNTKFGERQMFNLAYLSQDTLRICLEIKSKEAFDKLIAKLEAGTLPDNAFPKSTNTIKHQYYSVEYGHRVALLRTGSDFGDTPGWTESGRDMRQDESGVP